LQNELKLLERFALIEKEFYSYSNFIEDIRSFQKMLPQDIDTIVAISRGGLTISHFLAEALNIRKVFSINSISYNENEKLENIEVFGIPDLNGSQKVLIVDDISDSGRTFKAINEKLSEYYPKADLSNLAIFYGENSQFEPDYFIYKSSKWINFFWSEDFK
jgi:xanthine phosphoribosyltransferase